MPKLVVASDALSKRHRCTKYWKSNWWLKQFFPFLISRLSNPLKVKLERESKLQQSYNLQSFFRDNAFFVSVRNQILGYIFCDRRTDIVMTLYSCKIVLICHIIMIGLWDYERLLKNDIISCNIIHSSFSKNRDLQINIQIKWWKLPFPTQIANLLCSSV